MKKSIMLGLEYLHDWVARLSEASPSERALLESSVVRQFSLKTGENGVEHDIGPVWVGRLMGN